LNIKTAQHNFDSYLAEFIFRQEMKEENFLEWIFKKISEIWPSK
jgi:hypothetical protein